MPNVTDEHGGLPHQLSMELPADLAGGAHADAASIWHTAESFVLDFFALKTPPQPGTAPDGSQILVTEALVTSRVRMAPTHVIELMKALEQQLSKWETENGHRKPVEPPHPDL